MAMKVLLYIPTLKGGGAEKVFVNLANYFSSAGVEVTLVTSHLGYYQDKVSANVSLKAMSKGGRSFGPVRRICTSLLSLVVSMVRIKPDVVMATLTEANVIAWFAHVLTFRRRKLILRQASLIDFKLFDKRKGLKDKLFDALLIPAVRSADMVVANSDDTADSVVDYVKINRHEIRVIPNPVLTSDFSGGELRESSFNFNEDAKYILNVASLTDRKDHITLLNAFNKVSVVCKEAQLLLLGEGPLLHGLEAMTRQLGLEGRVHFLGYVRDPRPFYRHARVFVLSSTSEGFGNVLVEALSYGLPIVSTKCSGGPSFILNHGEYGLLTPVGDFGAMSNAILQALDDQNVHLRAKRVERARQFSVEKVGQLYLKALTTLLHS